MSKMMNSLTNDRKQESESLSIPQYRNSAASNKQDISTALVQQGTCVTD